MTSYSAVMAAADVSEMFVVKRQGHREIVSFDKILQRIRKIGEEAGIRSINYTTLAIKVIDQLFDGITTTRLDELMAEQCIYMSATHYDYGTLASRLIISNHHRNTVPRFSEAVEALYNNCDAQGDPCPLLHPVFVKFVRLHAAWLDALVGDCSRDYLIDYFGFKTLERAYLLSVQNTASTSTSTSGDAKTIVERPQYMWLRVAIGIHLDTTMTEQAMKDEAARFLANPELSSSSSSSLLHRIQETYDLMSQKYFVHATPTLFNAGTPRPQLSSCFLVATEDDSIEGIFNTLKDCAMISKYSGGIGLHIHNVRASGSYIRGTNGKSNGIVPMLKVFNNTARYVNQGGKRNGSIAVYLEPWHADIELFLDMRKNHGDEDLKARDLFYALWIPDLFMRRVEANESWTLFCPRDFPGLSDVVAADFEALYKQYEAAVSGEGAATEAGVQGKIFKTIRARDLWFRILDAQMETGTPYLLYKDACNVKSNQSNLGVIKSSNLCCEVVEYSNHEETAVCNLASIALPAFVDPVSKTFDFDKLHAVTKVVVRNLDLVIDRNFYPTKKTSESNRRHRPVGVGVQGLADAFLAMDLAFCSPAAKRLNAQIFETIYHAAVEMSVELARTKGCYESFHAGRQGSPASRGLFQFDLWEPRPDNDATGATAALPGRYDWEELRRNMMKHGLRNSLLVAPMPTASTSQILGCNECFEPFTSNIYSRRTMAGEFIVTNKYLMRDLMDAGLWKDEATKKLIIANQGSVQQLVGLSQHVKDKYLTVWEMSMRDLIDMAADRGRYICQSQSLNLWIEDPDYAKLTSMHFYAWKKGLKTGMYYLRRRAKHKAQQFTIDPKFLAQTAAAAASPSSSSACEHCSA